jgi:SAM-dependent methyltransferase
LPEYDLNQEWVTEEIYDVAFCLEVFEYVYNPWQAMRNLWGILKKGGNLYASFHFIYPHHGPRGRDYLRYTQWGVDKLLEEAGFRSWERYSRPFRRPSAIGFVYLGEKMKGIDHNRGPIHADQGYLIKAWK